MTKEEKRAIKRICEDYDFEDFKELKRTIKDEYGDVVDEDWFANPSDEDTCYNELERLVAHKF